MDCEAVMKTILNTRGLDVRYDVS